MSRTRAQLALVKADPDGASDQQAQRQSQARSALDEARRQLIIAEERVATCEELLVHARKAYETAMGGGDPWGG
ncbi:MAG TPA: hypothetical protein VNL71_11310, partial [Chloroflexota bacterium]|nr:hypothetical protein [Chloroflexota bacterium]